MKKIVFAAGLLVALLLVAKGAGAQQVNIKSFPGNSVGEKLTAAAALTTAGGGCVSGLTCILIIPPEMSVYATGTLPTMGANQMAISYMDPANVKVIATGASTLSNIGGTFTGGTITSALLGPVGACTAGNVTYSFTGNTSNGWYFDTTYGLVYCGATVDAAAFLVGGTGLRMQSGFKLQFTAAGTAKATPDLEAGRLAPGLIGVGQLAGEVDAVFGGKTTCDSQAASRGVFCYDVTAQKWKYSENNGALANAFAASTGPTYYVNSTTVTVSNTVTETNLQTVTMAATNPINAANKVLRVTASGRFGVETATTNFTWKFYYNGTLVGTFTVLGEASLTQNQRWRAQCEMTVVSAGASGTVWTRCQIIDNINAGPFMNTETAVTTVDTTVASPVVKFTCTMGTASANRNCGSDQMLAEVLN